LYSIELLSVECHYVTVDILVFWLGYVFRYVLLLLMVLLLRPLKGQLKMQERKCRA